MRCTRCGSDTRNRAIDMTHFRLIKSTERIWDYFYCRRCETFAFESLPKDSLTEQGEILATQLSEEKQCQYCSHPEVPQYEGLTFIEVRVEKAHHDLFKKRTRFLIHQECAGFIFNRIPAAGSGQLSDKWFTPRRPYIASENNH